MTKTLNDRLFDAIKEDDIKEVSKCLKEGAVVYATDSKGRTPLHLAYKSVAIAELLIEHRADPNATDNEGLTPLHKACSRGRTAVAELLIENGANVNATDHGSPLYIAWSFKRNEIVKLLISAILQEFRVKLEKAKLRELLEFKL
ncbi:MAG TPA: ankyrin repeat domain-containing protein [Candidatus Aquirickettsiella sp.]|jgi:ankyrin repeat protein